MGNLLSMSCLTSFAFDRSLNSLDDDISNSRFQRNSERKRKIHFDSISGTGGDEGPMSGGSNSGKLGSSVSSLAVIDRLAAPNITRLPLGALVIIVIMSA